MLTDRLAALTADGAQPDGADVAHFGDPAGELQAARAGAAHADLLRHENLHLHGAAAVAYLDRLTTLKVSALPVGGASPAFFLDARGRVEAGAWLLRRGDDDLLALCAPGQAEPLRALLDRYHFGEAICFEPAEGGHWRTILGPKAPEALAAIGWPVPPQGALAHHEWGVLARTDRLGPHTYDAWIHDAAWATVRAQLTGAGAVETGAHTLLAARLLAGAAAHPHEYGPHGSPLEIGMAGITDGKGCYPGQEVIERTLALGKPARALRRLTLSGPAAVGTSLLRDGKPAGLLTSAVALPDGQWIGLGLIKRSLADDPAPFQVEQATAHIIQEPPL
ncbi:MAG: hypothetical protein H6702_24040 [Myxococcales bacterium]|nr:hypothetical protein [Myxococcales bacterium]